MLCTIAVVTPEVDAHRSQHEPHQEWKSMRTSHQLRVIVLLMLAIAIARPALAQRTPTSGEFVTEPPTLVSLGFEWRIAGDDNRNAKVDVSFRKKSEPG